MEWVSFTSYAPGQRLPPERRLVLVQIAPRGPEPVALPGLRADIPGLQASMPAAVAVGYLRIWSAGPWFVIPGVGGEVMAWCDCLGDDFKPACWNFPEGNQRNHELAVWNGPEDRK